MIKSDCFLEIKIECESFSAGRISVNNLMRLLYDFNKILIRSGMVLAGAYDSVKTGAPKKLIREEIALDLIRFSYSNNTTLLEFSRRLVNHSFPEFDFGFEIFKKTISGLNQIMQDPESMPEGYDAGVILAWRDLGNLFEQKIKDITFTLNCGENPLTASYSFTGFLHVQKKIIKPMYNLKTVEGHLLMADFKEYGTRCRVHPADGTPILCLFDNNQKDEVLENLLNYVRIVGEAKEDPSSGKIISIKISDIQKIEKDDMSDEEIIPQGLPIPEMVLELE